MSCTSCRQRKIKCDKENPCSQCISSFYDCIYPESSRKRKRKLPLERIDSLESRLRAMESYIPPRAATLPVASSPVNSSTPNASSETVLASSNGNTASAEIGNGNVYHLDDHDEVEFQGQSADRSFMQCLRSKLSEWPGGDMTRRQFPSRASGPTFFEPEDLSSDGVTLPTKALAARLVEAAMDAQILLYIVHRPSFEISFNLVYSLDQSDYSAREKKFLPLLYAILAYGSLFIDPSSDGLGQDELVSQGSKFYAKSRQLQDIAECRDITSLQAIVFMNLFLLSSNRTSTCYTYLSASLSIALRMGLHRSLKTDQNLISQEMRKRLFWTLYLLVNEVAAFCGMPKLLDDDEIDQELPTEANDKYIEKNQIYPQPQNEICYISGANAYKQLLMVRDRVTKYVYPVRGLSATRSNGLPSHAVSLETIGGIQDDLDRWVKNIPRGYRLGTSSTETRLMRAQYILAMLYAHVQLYLYRPFLHYAVEARHQNSTPLAGISPYATASVQASENVIALCEEMYGRGLLNGDYWPVTRMLVSSIATILYFIVAPRTLYEADVLFKTLAAGRRILSRLAEHSCPANRGKVILTVTISTLPMDFQYVRDRLLNLDGEVPAGYQSGQTSRLASKTFSLSPKPSADRPWLDSAAASWEKGPGRNLDSLNASNNSQSNPRPQHSSSPTIPSPKTLIETSECCKSHGTSSGSSHQPIIVNTDVPDMTLMGSQSHLQNQHSDALGDINQDEFLQAQPLSFRQGSMDDSWANAFNMDSVNQSEDFQSLVMGLDDIGQILDLESWL
ncbi:fungal-specific transcription factor domain-containing protein [Aspergillus cavernicola]|uniref:Fungal-specific transcription factor domain-containing protein n=1 Tax=Aspergillus cavernicola TaxID=176166 RepID=A0ABR4J1A0_9EURO